MRASINLLQAASSTGEDINDKIVYAIAGSASPDTIRNMLVDAREQRYLESLQSLKKLIYNEGVSPVDLVRQIHKELQTLDLSPSEQMSVLEQIAEAEFRIGEGANGEIQLSALLAHIGLGSDAGE
jgi:replication factor C small subunit